MKVTNGQLWNAQEAGALKKLGHLGNCPFEKQLEISRFIKLLLDELQHVDGIRTKIFQKYGTAKGNVYTFPPDKVDEVNKEYGELMALDLEIPNAEKIEVSIGAETISELDALDMVALSPFVAFSVKAKK